MKKFAKYMGLVCLALAAGCGREMREPTTENTYLKTISYRDNFITEGYLVSEDKKIEALTDENGLARLIREKALTNRFESIPAYTLVMNSNTAEKADALLRAKNEFALAWAQQRYDAWKQKQAKGKETIGPDYRKVMEQQVPGTQ